MTDVYRLDPDDIAKQFVLGFAFSSDGRQIVLIEKDHPASQAGKLNGLGGKVKTGDAAPIDAVCRECDEEAGVSSTAADWHQYTILNGDFGQVIVFYAFDDKFLAASRKTGQEIKVMAVTDPAIKDRSVLNVYDLIQQALAEKYGDTEHLPLKSPQPALG